MLAIGAEYLSAADVRRRLMLAFGIQIELSDLMLRLEGMERAGLIWKQRGAFGAITWSRQPGS